MRHRAGDKFALALVASVMGAGVLPSGCASGPDYERPSVPTPNTYRSAASDAASRPSLGERAWTEVFADPTLRELIAATLRENYDLQIAATRVLQAEAQLGITRSASFPSVDATASVVRQRSRFGPGDPFTATFSQVEVAVAWEIDFWGRFRRANEAARAQILASEWARRAVLTTLVSQIATLYFDLRGRDRELDIARRTLAAREQSLRLTEVRAQGGTGSMVDVKQAEQLVYGASAEIARLLRLIEQRENSIATLVGRVPGAIGRGQELPAQARVVEIPTGLPSALLQRRPDIQRAEQELVAANAQIGVSQAAYFPQITLTGSGGVASAALSGLFSSPALIGALGASLTQPIFNAGRISSEVRLARLQREEAVLRYRQTILTAFREVSDALVGYQRGREQRSIQEALVAAAQEARRLAELRYQSGTSSYLEVLDSETRLFTAELSLVQAELGELSAYVEIYRALGGGWQT